MYLTVLYIEIIKTYKFTNNKKTVKCKDNIYAVFLLFVKGGISAIILF